MQLLPDPTIGPRFRVVKIFHTGLPASDDKALITQLPPNIAERRRDKFATLDGTVCATDSARDGLGYPATWNSYHPALTNPAVPSLMDNYWLAPGGMPEACMFDTLTRQFLRDRLLAKLSRP